MRDSMVAEGAWGGPRPPARRSSRNDWSLVCCCGGVDPGLGFGDDECVQCDASVRTHRQRVDVTFVDEIVEIAGEGGESDCCGRSGDVDRNEREGSVLVDFDQQSTMVVADANARIFCSVLSWHCVGDDEPRRFVMKFTTSLAWSPSWRSCLHPDAKWWRCRVRNANRARTSCPHRFAECSIREVCRCR